MWTRIRCSRCRDGFTSVTAFLAHTHTAGEDAMVEPEDGRRLDPAATNTIRFGSTRTATRTAKRSALPRDRHRVRLLASRSSSRTGA